MRDVWYSDNRDFVKWAILCHLAEGFEPERIIQIAFYRQCGFNPVEINGQKKEIPQKVIQHFRNILNIGKMESNVPIEVFNVILNNQQRQDYLQKTIDLINKYSRERLIVFLDPDTGLEPMRTKPKPEHVLNVEAKNIWDALKIKDVFVFYQHQTNRRGEGWIEPKKNQLAQALGLESAKLKVACGPKIANDVALFYAQKD